MTIATPEGSRFLWLVLAACIMLVGLVLSSSRAGATATAVGLVFLLGFSARGVDRRHSFSIVSGILTAALVYSFIASPISAIGRFGDTLQDLVGPEGRASVWWDSARMAGSFSATGSGLGTFEGGFPVFRSVGNGQHYRHAHNDYLELAAELGLPGLSLGLLLLAMFFRRTMPSILRWARARMAPDVGGGHLAQGTLVGGAAAVVALALHSLFDFNLHVPANLLTLSVVCALALPGPCMERVRKFDVAAMSRTLDRAAPA